MPPPIPAPILLVEDNHGDVMLFEEAMENGSGNLALRVATTVDEGIRLLQGDGTPGSQVRPVVILLDLHLPGKDGKAFLRYLKEHPEFQDIPVIMLSSSTRQKDVDDCVHLGAHYRVKPYDWAGYQELVGFLRQFLAGAVGATPGA